MKVISQFGTCSCLGHRYGAIAGHGTNEVASSGCIGTTIPDAGPAVSCLAFTYMYGWRLGVPGCRPIAGSGRALCPCNGRASRWHSKGRA